MGVTTQRGSSPVAQFPKSPHFCKAESSNLSGYHSLESSYTFFAEGFRSFPLIFLNFHVFARASSGTDGFQDNSEARL